MIWVVVVVLSLLLTFGMGGAFFVVSMIALNGFPNMAAAMPTYLTFNLCAWPMMVGVTTLATWVVFLMAKQKRPFWHIALPNAIIVTTFLALMALALSTL